MKIEFESADLRPLVEQIVDEVSKRKSAVDHKLDVTRLAFPEGEAASALGIAPHVLRDARLRGELKAKKLGRRWLYSRQALADFFDH